MGEEVTNGRSNETNGGGEEMPRGVESLEGSGEEEEEQLWLETLRRSLRALRRTEGK